MILKELVSLCDEYTHFMIYDVNRHIKYECNKYTVDFRDLPKHIKSIYVENSTIICNLISKKFVDE